MSPPSLRERKKLATRTLLRQVALSLVAERGFANVTVEDIAQAADLSPRTFFNYFPSKEAAVSGMAMPAEAEMRDRILHELPGQPVLDVLRLLMLHGAQGVTDELTALGGDPAGWLHRIRAVMNDPQLRAANAGRMVTVERTFTEAIAARLGTDPVRDPYPALLCAVAIAAFRASMASWASSGGAVPLSQLIDQAFAALASGLPERHTERHTETTHGKDDR